MVTKKELVLYARLERVKDKVSNYLEGLEPIVLIYLFFLLASAPLLAIMQGINVYYLKQPPEAKPFNKQQFEFICRLYLAYISPFLLYPLAFVIALIDKMLQYFKPLQNRLAAYNESFSQEYKKIYKPISYDDLMWLLKEINYDLSPNSTISLLNSDDPRNVTYTIHLLASQAGASTIFKFLEAIAIDRINVMNILRDDWQSNRLSSLAIHKVTSYLQQSKMDLFLRELQSTNGWGLDYRGKNLFNKIQFWTGGPISEQLTAQDYAILSKLIMKHKNQIERAAEKLLATLEKQAPQPKVEQQLDSLQVVSFVPQFRSRFNARAPLPQRATQVFDDAALYDEEKKSPLINSLRPNSN